MFFWVASSAGLLASPTANPIQLCRKYRFTNVPFAAMYQSNCGRSGDKVQTDNCFMITFYPKQNYEQVVDENISALLIRCWHQMRSLQEIVQTAGKYWLSREVKDRGLLLQSYTNNKMLTAQFIPVA